MGTIPADGGRVVVLMLVVIVTGGNRSRAEVTARAPCDNTQHGQQRAGGNMGASRPGDTIRNGNNGGAWRNRHNGRNVGADVILMGVGLLPALAHGWRRRVYNPPIIPRQDSTGKHLPALPAPPPSLLIYIISIYKI